MPAISKIRFTHVLYEGGNKRYNDETFLLDGHNGAILLENGGGKTVFIQTALQAMLPHTDLSGRKLKDTLMLENGPAHIAIEWILNDKPRRRYALTCVSLFLSGNSIDSYRYVYEYGEHDAHSLDHVPFVKEYMGKSRPADKGEMQEYYSSMSSRFPLKACTFDTIKSYKAYLEENFQIISAEWDAIVKINDTEGGIEKFFDDCKTTSQLFDKLLIPTVEQAIEGYEQSRFVEIFESHREGFKRYKELKEQIEDNQLIQKKLSQYVQLHEKLYDSKQLYDEARRKAIAYRNLAQFQHEEQQAEFERLEDKRILQQQQSEELLRQKKSLELLKADQLKAEKLLKLEHLQDEVDYLQEQQEKAQRTYYSIQYAVYREKKQQAQYRLVQLENQLERLDQSEDEQDFQERWERSGGQLRTAFANKELDFTKKLETHKLELSKLEQEQQETKNILSELQADIRKWELEHHKILTHVEEKTSQRQKLANSILANPALETVEDLMPVWSAHQQRLEEEQIDSDRMIKRLGEEHTLIIERQKSNDSEMMESQTQKTQLEQQLKYIQDEHIHVIQELATLRANWQRLSSIYDKEATITEQLKEGVTRRLQQKAELLFKERTAFRYVDDYYEQELFFADSSIEKKLKSWKRQFPSLQTGIEYIASIGQKEYETLEDKLWAVTVVISETDKQSIQQKLLDVREEFAYPIRILSLSEASLMVQGSVNQEQGQWVVPGFWQGNTDQEAFDQFKQGLLTKAEFIRLERESKEAELRQWLHAEDRVCGFLSKYSFAHYQQLEEQLQSSRDNLITITNERKQLEQRLKQLNDELDNHRRDQKERQNSIHQLDIWIKDGQLYMILGSEKRKLEAELVPIKQQLENLQKQLKMKSNRLEQVHAEHKEVQQVWRGINLDLQLLRNDELYQASQIFIYVTSERSLFDLKEEFKVLAREREGFVKERKQLEQEKAHEQEKEEEAQATMVTLLREHTDLDLAAIVPIELASRNEELWNQIESCREQLKPKENKLNKQQNELQGIEGKIIILKEQYDKDFPERPPSQFEGDVQQAEEWIQLEHNKLEQDIKVRQQQHDSVRGKLEELEKSLQLWEKYSLLHRLNTQQLSSAHLDEQQIISFTYERMKCSEQVAESLQVCSNAVSKEQNKVNQGVHTFKEYCLSHVKDVKLRQMVIKGVELKTEYKEIMEFQHVMSTRIQKAIHIMQETIQTYDRDLQEFIHRMHMHLRQITYELKELPKKTRIRTAEGWREIFSFSIPEWDEQDGKDRIREHVEWIVTQLEKDRYQDEHGYELQNDIRKSLEKWLDTKQLLHVVLKSETMRVTCRKVMNDHQVTKASYSWEQSNRWSGGEKWSKNMTLFLGMLNYVAERKQYIQTHMKLHRTVILDNPFGKASSDHVLSPVFFIAEQLGFQIIALTAHAEGKFLQDYFPIVYSCRLRHTSDASKQIIESKKQIQYAYFKDNSPETLERIDARVGQITLF